VGVRVRGLQLAAQRLIVVLAETLVCHLLAQRSGVLVVGALRHRAFSACVETTGVAVRASLLVAQAVVVAEYKVADCGALPGAKNALRLLGRRLGCLTDGRPAHLAGRDG